MIVLAGLWELGWNTPIKEADLWEMVARDFGVTIAMCPVSGVRLWWEGGLLEYADLPAALTALGLPGVFVDEHGTVPLRDFVHPESCVYVFGKTSTSALYAMREGDVSVSVETPGQLGMMWAHQAAAIVLYDRQVKSWPQP